MKKNTISCECDLAIGWLAPHFKQIRRISIAIWNIEESWFQYQLQQEPFLAENWLKMKENTISWEWNLALGWLTPRFKQNRRISIVS